MDSLLAAAPEIDTSSALGQVSSLLGSSDSSLGGLASLTSSFDSLNMDKNMVGKFLPAVYDYVDSVSGEQAMSLLKGLF